jgi:hypothetical protein
MKIHTRVAHFWVKIDADEKLDDMINDFIRKEEKNENKEIINVNIQYSGDAQKRAFSALVVFTYTEKYS